MPRKSTDAQFIAAWQRCGGSPAEVARALDTEVTNVYARRVRLEKRGTFLQTVPRNPHAETTGWQTRAHPYTPRFTTTLTDGYLVVFGDAHYWPGEPSLAHQAMLKVIKLVKPKMIIANGDVFDGATVSRHDPLGWQSLPTVIEELDVVKLRLGEIEQAAGKAILRKTVGNHDSRFDRRLATEAGEFKDVAGFRLQDHIKAWPMSYSVLLNEDIDPVFVLHNIRGGMHAPSNNAKAAGCTVITGHLHSQKAMPVTTLLHDWEGIDHGMLAERDGPQFSYRMDRPADWRSGFCVMRFDKDGRRYPAELCRVQYLKDRARAVFRSEVILERG